MSEQTLLDFDAFWGERVEETLPARFEGVVYHVPLTPPVAAVLTVLRLRKAGQSPSADEAFELAGQVLGEANFEQISARNTGLSVPKLMAFLEFVSNQQGKAITPVPNRATRRAAKRRNPSTSSSAGRSSKPTSSVSTGSTSAQV